MIWGYPYYWKHPYNARFLPEVSLPNFGTRSPCPGSGISICSGNSLLNLANDDSPLSMNGQAGLDAKQWVMFKKLAIGKKMGTYGDHTRSSSITKHHGLVFDVMLDDIYILMKYDHDLNMKSNKLKYLDLPFWVPNGSVTTGGQTNQTIPWGLRTAPRLEGAGTEFCFVILS